MKNVNIHINIKMLLLLFFVNIILIIFISLYVNVLIFDIMQSKKLNTSSNIDGSIAAESFVAFNKAGNRHARLHVDTLNNIPILSFYDNNGFEQLSLFIDNNGSSKILFFHNKLLLMSNSIDKTGIPSINMYDINNNKKISIFVDTHGSPNLAFFDNNGVMRLELSTDRSGSPFLRFFDINKHVIYRIP